MPGKNIIFKNKVLSLGTKDLPIIFERYEKNNKKIGGLLLYLAKIQMGVSLSIQIL